MVEKAAEAKGPTKTRECAAIDMGERETEGGVLTEKKKEQREGSYVAWNSK